MNAIPIRSLAALAVVAAVTTTTGSAAAAPADFTYKDRAINAALAGPEDPTAAHPTIELLSAGMLNISGHDILAYRTRTMEPLDASASLTGDWLGCDTATDELISVVYNGSSPLPEGSVTVDRALTSGTMSATWPVQVTVERTPSCTEPDFELSTTQTFTETVRVEMSVVSDGSPPVTDSGRDPSMGTRWDSTYQSGIVTRVVVEGEYWVPDWQADSPHTVSASLSASSRTERY